MEPDQSFGWALEVLKEGGTVCRDGWNGKGMWLMLVHGKDWSFSPSVVSPSLPQQPFIVMKTAQDTYVPWLASQSDMLAEDWCKLG